MRDITLTSDLYETYRGAKASRLYCVAAVRIICDSQEQAREILGMAQRDEDHEGDAELPSGYDIWGMLHTAAGNAEYRIELQYPEAE